MLCLAESSENPSCRYTAKGASEVLVIFPQPQFLSPRRVSKAAVIDYMGCVSSMAEGSINICYVNSPPPTPRMVKHSSHGPPGNPIPLT